VTTTGHDLLDVDGLRHRHDLFDDYDFLDRDNFCDDDGHDLLDVDGLRHRHDLFDDP
jgi:hypothetical protein